MPPIRKRIAGALAASIAAPYSVSLQFWVWEITHFKSDDPHEYLIWLNLDGEIPHTFNAFQALVEALAIATYGMIYISPFLLLISLLIAWHTEAFRWAVLTGMLLGGGIATPFFIAEPTRNLFLLIIQGIMSGALCGWIYGLIAFSNPNANRNPPQSEMQS